MYDETESKNRIKLRQFSEQDYPAVIKIWQDSGLTLSRDDSLEGLRHQILRDPDLFLVAEEGDSLVGAVLGRYDGRRGWIYHLAVRPLMQNKGIGTLLLQELEARLLSKGCTKINLHTIADAEQARQFYRTRGYASNPLVYMEKWLR